MALKNKHRQELSCSRDRLWNALCTLESFVTRLQMKQDADLLSKFFDFGENLPEASGTQPCLPERAAPSMPGAGSSLGDGMRRQIETSAKERQNRENFHRCFLNAQQRTDRCL